MLFDTLASIFKATLPHDEKVRLAQKEIETEDSVLVGEMLKRRPRLDPAKMQWFSEEVPIDLSVARNNKLIWDRGGRGLFVTYFSGDPDETKIRFNEIASSLYRVNSGHIKGAFLKLYLTNTAQAGKKLKFLVGYRNFADFQMLGVASVVQLKNIAAATINPATKEGLDAIAALDFATQTTLAALAGVDFASQTTLALIKAKTDELANLVNKATTYQLYNIEMVNATTEYSQALPAATKILRVQTADGTEFNLSFEPDCVVGGLMPCMIILANEVYNQHDLDLTGKTLYFACGVAGKWIKITAWT